MRLSISPLVISCELGNLLVVAPTRGGKGLLATAQLLSWKHSVIVNDIKGDLFTQTAGRTAIPSLADHSTTVVGRGVSLWIAVQSLSQLDAVYGKVPGPNP